MGKEPRRYRWPLCLAICLPVATGHGQEPKLPNKSASAPATDLPVPRKAEGSVRPPSSPATLLGDKATAIDLPAALRLAGVQNPQLLLARERVAEAVALRQLAAAQILPNINVGTNLDLHTGTLQQSTGNIIKVNRGSLYVGLGANAVGSGTVSVPGISYNLNVSEAIFTGLIARQEVRRRELASVAVQNDTLLRVGRAYLALLEAEARRAIVLQTRAETAEVARITASFARVGQGRPADASRAEADLLQRDTEVARAEEDVLTASARLCELLGLDPSVRLHVVDAWAVPAPVVPDAIPLPELIAIALLQRPELGERRTAIQQALLALSGARLLPFSPSVILGFSTGNFGGGSDQVEAGIPQANGTVLRGSRFGAFDGRADFDLAVFWTARNLGAGNVALVREAESRLRSANLRELETLNRIRTEVAEAHARTYARFAQIATGERATRASQEGFREDLARARKGVGLPIELLDSLRLLGRARVEYLNAIIQYNRAQLELYVSLGQPPADGLARPVPADLVPPPTSTTTDPAPPRIQPSSKRP